MASETLLDLRGQLTFRASDPHVGLGENSYPDLDPDRGPWIEIATDPYDPDPSDRVCEIDPDPDRGPGERRGGRANRRDVDDRDRVCDLLGGPFGRRRGGET